MCLDVSGSGHRPSDAAQPKEATAPGLPSPGLAGCRVLVVEDEYFLADDMARALCQLGAEVIGPVPTCDDALMYLKRGERIDAAVLDINLRGEMSFSVADALSARGVPFVFASGYERATVPPVHGNVPHWEKPFESEDLVRALPGLVRRPRPTR